MRKASYLLLGAVCFAGVVGSTSLWAQGMVKLGTEPAKALIPGAGPQGKAAIEEDLLVADVGLQAGTANLKERPSADFTELRNAQSPAGIPEPKMLSLPGGSFHMGCVSGQKCSSDEKPVHKVTLEPFQMSATEVTFAQYEACVARRGCDHDPDDSGWGRGSRPVINVSWEDAQDYIKWLTDQTGKSYRLPTEAQWEYAARASSQTVYSWGNQIGSNKANCDGCGSQWDGEQTAPVASFAANSFGLYDLHGNVYEWCNDWHASDYYQQSPSSNPQGPTTGSRRVSRGGSWDRSPYFARSALRSSRSPDSRSSNLGFRLVLPQGPGAGENPPTP